MTVTPTDPRALRAPAIALRALCGLARLGDLVPDFGGAFVLLGAHRFVKFIDQTLNQSLPLKRFIGAIRCLADMMRGAGMGALNERGKILFKRVVTIRTSQKTMLSKARKT